ncbi:hypothetical protein PC129_g997 [Phytophthora cactorum]|uniref:Uncharacterized protein n=1 Tax=Phytophthora cactorum TaxID=29920 RepID=A0A8T1ISI7_9STRA|nr:hypothetical protein PC114_g4704 [Phytophthora cactorum]KAG3228435.1 hypothetical protein PC129_g997 [Phytophthora cactorum]
MGRQRYTINEKKMVEKETKIATIRAVDVKYKIDRKCIQDWVAQVIASALDKVPPKQGWPSYGLRGARDARRKHRRVTRHREIEMAANLFRTMTEQSERQAFQDRIAGVHAEDRPCLMKEHRDFLNGTRVEDANFTSARPQSTSILDPRRPPMGNDAAYLLANKQHAADTRRAVVGKTVAGSGKKRLVQKKQVDNDLWSDDAGDEDYVEADVVEKEDDEDEAIAEQAVAAKNPTPRKGILSNEDNSDPDEAGREETSLEELADTCKRSQRGECRCEEDDNGEDTAEDDAESDVADGESDEGEKKGEVESKENDQSAISQCEE